MSDLTACPFCGGKVEEHKFQWNMSQAACIKCGERWGACGAKYSGRFKKWNHRAQQVEAAPSTSDNT